MQSPRSCRLFVSLAAALALAVSPGCDDGGSGAASTAPPTAGQGRPAGSSVYQINLESGTPGPEWDRRPVTDTPNESRFFLGPFASEGPVVLTLEDLPPHQAVRVTFDLLIQRSWDGPVYRIWGNGQAGPDVWRLEDISPDGRRRRLIDTVFSNVPPAPTFKPGCYVQYYPSPIPGDKLPAQAGAAEVSTQGYELVDFPMDAVYRPTVTFSHRGETLTLAFLAEGLLDINDESWGLAAVRVEPLADAPTAPAADALPALLETAARRPEWSVVDAEAVAGWTVNLLPENPQGATQEVDENRPDRTAILTDSQARAEVARRKVDALAIKSKAAVATAEAAAEAFGQLVLAGDATVELLARSVKPAEPVDRAALSEQMHRLRPAPDLGTADPATDEIAQSPRRAGPHLRALIEEMPLGLERGQAELALRLIDARPVTDPDERRWVLALRLLEVIDTPAARDLAARLAPVVGGPLSSISPLPPGEGGRAAAG